MVSTTGEDAVWYVLDEALVARPEPMPPEVQRVVDRIGDRQPAARDRAVRGWRRRPPARRCHENPILLTRSIK